MPRLLFLATAKSGLGHVRRLANIARHMAGRGVELELGLNADPVGLEADERAYFAAIHRCERADMAKLAAQRAADIVVADTLELPALAAFPGRRVLVLRETPRDRQARFRLSDDAMWDLVIVPNPQAHWQPCGQVIGAHAIESVGWVYRRAREQAHAERTIVLIAAGGGGDGGTARVINEVVWPWLAGLIEHFDGRIDYRQVMGPRADRNMRLPQPVQPMDAGANLVDAFASADLVISTAGYNSVLELASCTTPAILFPIGRSFDDQTSRARLWGPLLGRYFDPLNSSRLSRWCITVLSERKRRAAIDLGPSGASRAAELLLSLPA